MKKSHGSRQEGINSNIPTALDLEAGVGDKESPISAKGGSDLEDQELVQEGQSGTTNGKEEKRTLMAQKLTNRGFRP